MRAAIHDASARQNSGGPAPVLGRGGDRNNRPRNPGTTELEDEIAGLVNRSTHELRVAWRKLHRMGPPLGLSRRSDDPNRCQQIARARPWRSQPRAAAAPAEPGWR